MPTQTLIPADLLRRLPPLYSTEGQADPLARVKLFAPWSTWTWYAVP